MACTIVARLLGSRELLSAGYLSGIVSGPIDADKLDYMARDSYYTGLPIGLDVRWLISKIEVISVTPQNVKDPHLRERAEKSSSGRFYDVGISVAGLTAYEQMVVGRVLLYDRVYYHHKVRASEAMVRRLIDISEEERGGTFALRDLFQTWSDDTLMLVVSDTLQHNAEARHCSRSRALCDAIRSRHFYHRAFAFASRFLAGLDSLTDKEQDNTRALLWSEVRLKVTDAEVQRQLEKEIFDRVVQLAKAVPDLKDAADILPEHILIDLPAGKVTATGGPLLMRTETGFLQPVSLYFDAQKWSDAFKSQKECGFVFCPRKYLPAVTTAARIIFYERFQCVFSSDAFRLCKTDGFVKAEWIQQAADNNLCSAECLAALTAALTRLVFLGEDQLELPARWTSEDGQLKKRLADTLRSALPGGFPASVAEALQSSIRYMCAFVDTVEKNGTFLKSTKLQEKGELQKCMLAYLRMAEVEATEGAEIAGGESDVILPGNIVVENKVAGEVSDPRGILPNADWQLRRYSMAVNQRVGFVVVAYRPANEAAVLPLPDRVSVYPVGANEERVIIRLLIPYGHGVPSSAKAGAG